jgi:6-phosphofructokinase 1
MDKIQKIGILTSGGDAPGMNAAIRACVRACIYYKLQPVAISEGYRGLINKKFNFDITARSVANILNRGGTIFKSSRCAEFMTPEGRELAHKNLVDAGIDALVIIGGNGSLSGANKLYETFNFPCVGIPATIDNDIFGTDYTIGYDTASNTVMDAIDKIRDTASSHNRLFLIEVMGRDAGFIALNAGIATGAEQILIPEQENTIERIINSIKKSNRAGKTSSIVVVAEGNQSGSAFNLSHEIEKKFPEYTVKVTVLGHIQRGGNPSIQDRVLASRFGVAAIENLVKKVSGVMVGIKNQQDSIVSLEDAISRNNAIDKKMIDVANIISI